MRYKQLPFVLPVLHRSPVANNKNEKRLLFTITIDDDGE
jgi:hypothetical protein